jgi:23S rRNA pseudoU1915 N3-methylase RlmH
MGVYEQQVTENTKAIKGLIDNAKNINGLQPLTDLVNLQDKIALYKESTGETLKTSIAQLVNGGVGTSVINHPVMISFGFPLNNKTDINSLHGTLLDNGTQSGVILNSGTSITKSGGISKVMINVVSGSVTIGSLLISGTSVDRNTGIETIGDTESIAINGITTDTTTIDSNGNNVYNYSGAYISTKWWKGTLTYSTSDLDLTNVKFARVAFEQFDSIENLVINTLDTSYSTSNTAAKMDLYLYTVEVVGGRLSISKIAEQHHETGLPVNNFHRKRNGLLNKSLDASVSGVFIDLFLNPINQTYFSNFITKVWATAAENVNVVIDGSLGLDNIIYGESLQVGDLVYLNPNGKYLKADNTDVLKSSTELRLIIEAGLLDDEKLALAQGKYTGSGLTAGLEYVGTNGTITNSRPLGSNIVRIVSTAIDTTTRYFNPSQDFIKGDGSAINGITLSNNNEYLDSLFRIVNSDNQTKKVQVSAELLDGNKTVLAKVQNRNGVLAYLDDINQTFGKSNYAKASYFWIPNTYSYNVTVTEFYLGTILSSTIINTIVTLDPSDATLDRIDSIVVNLNKTISVVKGTPATVPTAPELDIETQLLITSPYVTAATTQPVGSSELLIYNENLQEVGGEWDTSTNNPPFVNLASTERASVGTKSAKIVNANSIALQSSVKYNASELSNVLVDVYLLNSTNNSLRLQLWVNNSTRIGEVYVIDGTFNFDARKINQWQTIIIPGTSFSITGSFGSSQYDRLWINNNKNNTTLFIDNVRLQQGISTPATPVQHTHNNLPLLETITQILVDSWNSAVTWISTNGTNLINHLTATGVHIKPVREVGTTSAISDADNGGVIIVTASCTLTIPNGLVAGFECSFVTLTGVTLIIALGGSVVLFNNVGLTMNEKLSFTLKNRTLANNYITAGSL